MQETRENINAIVAGGRYARTDEELYEKAIALLDKCKIERPGPDHETSRLEPVVNES